MNITFFIASGIAIFATFMAISGRHPVHALLYLILSLLATAVIFFTLGAPFLAALEVIIYAGAIIVLFLFVVMLLNLGPDDRGHDWIKGIDWVGPGILCLLLFGALAYTIFSDETSALGGSAIPPDAVGRRLFQTYMLGVQMAALLLLAGLVGATHLRKRDS